MGRYLTRRLLQTIPILLGVSIVVFIIIHTAPGDPYAYLFGPRTDPTLRARLREEMGFNDPIPVQYVRWFKTTISGNLGYSIRTQEPVIDMMAKALPRTLLLTGSSFLLGLAIAIPIGVVSATRQYSALDYAATTFAFMGISLPSFFAALLAIYFFAVKLPIFPMNGIHTPGVGGFWDVLHHLVLPAVTLGLRDAASYARFTRSSMLEVLRQDYVRTARAKGLAERIVIYKHALRNGLIPVITLLGFSLPGLFGGAVIIEQVFTFPGMGLLTFEAVNNRDYSVLMATNMFFALLVIIGNLVADILYAVADPRIRYA
ncbi:peptide/nickel transport system permease protein [Symbiobacterium terraclitae]|uniref:Peptide/nickel transport system permease protein n=1 Tax=Symbiobacterium terraclitae TaxID=557451 RepID=A0ABS4JU30_9FIRM|nr:peptide/nickel transport system permease protein [Symbiobacterium terraclitae]